MKQLSVAVAESSSAPGSSAYTFRLLIRVLPGIPAAMYMEQLRLYRIPNKSPVMSCSSLHQHDSCIHVREGFSPASRLSSRVSPKSLTEVFSRSRFVVSSRSGEFLGGEYVRDERVRVGNTRTRAYREEDWAKLFKPEAVNKEELKEYLNDDPIWLWVFKSWHSGIKGLLEFLWRQPGQIKYIEWPSVMSTIRMALLTLVVVLFLMVFLYLVDALFRHLLRMWMRPIA